MSTPVSKELLEQCLKPDGPVVIEVEHLTPAEANHLVAAVAAHDIQARVIDLGPISTKAELLRAIATALAFPSHFGNNWDALVDCWSDLSWLPAGGYLCILLGADAFRAAHKPTHDTLLGVCNDVAQRWHEHDPKIVFKVVRSAK